MRSITNVKQVLSMAIIAAVGFGVVGGTGLAQDDATEPAETIVTHPSHVHVGPCSEPDPNPAYPLNNIGPRTDGDGNAPEPEDIKGSLTANAVEFAETDIEVNMDDLLTQAHSIIVHESDQNMGNYIACADIGGAVIDDKLYVGMGPLNESGYNGIAELESDGDNTKVKIYLVRSVDAAMPDATPAP